MQKTAISMMVYKPMKGHAANKKGPLKTKKPKLQTN